MNKYQNTITGKIINTPILKSKNIESILSWCYLSCLILYCLLFFIDIFVYKGRYHRISLLLNIPFIIYIFLKLTQMEVKFTNTQYIIFVLAILMILSILFQKSLFPTLIDKNGRDSFHYTLYNTISSLIWISLGFVFNNTKFEESFFLPIIVIFIIYSLFSPYIENNIYLNLEKVSEGSYFATLNHLVIGGQLSVLSFLIYSISPSFFKPVVFFCIIYGLFCIGGRSGLFISIFTILVFEFFFNKRLLLIYIILFSILILFLLSRLKLEESFISRMFFMDGVSNDFSALERKYFFKHGLTCLGEQILWGKSSVLVREYNDMGAYIHNILSAWQFFGFFPFLLLVGLTIRSVFKCSLILFSNRFRKNNFLKFMILLTIYSIISILTVKYIFFFPFWFVIGFWSNNKIIL